MERYFLTHLTWPETILQGAAALLLIWANPLLNYIGLVLFILLFIYQLIRRKTHPGPQPLPPKPA